MPGNVKDVTLEKIQVVVLGYLYIFFVHRHHTNGSLPMAHIQLCIFTTFMCHILSIIISLICEVGMFVITVTIPVSVKITLFRSFCTSLYTCELWWQYRSESLRKLCVAYNNVFRFLCSEPRNCSASHMFVSRGLPTCNMLIRKRIYAFMTSTKRSYNTILQNIVGSDPLYTSPLLQHWRRMLYVHAY